MSEENISYIIENIFEVVYSVNINETGNWKLNYISPKIETLIGLSIDQCENQFPTLSKYYHPDDVEEINRLKQKAETSKESVIIAYRFKHSITGKYLWVEENYLCKYNDEGKVIGNFATVRNITQHKLAEMLQNVVLNISATASWIQTDMKALVRHVQFELNKILDANDLYIAINDDAKKRLDLYFAGADITQGEEYVQRPFGNGLTEFVINKGKPLHLSKSDLESLILDKNLINTEGTPTGWLVVPLKSEGRTIGCIGLRAFEADFQYSDDDFQILKFIAIQISNVVGMHMMQRNLLRNEEYYRAITENAMDIVFIINETGVIQYSSQSVEKFLGYQPYNLTGKNILEHVKEGHKNKWLINESVTDADDLMLREFKFKNKNGEWVQLEGFQRNLLNDVNIHGIIINARDITQRKQAESSLLNVIVKTQEKERERFSRDLHDGLGQTLTAARISLNIIKEQLDIPENSPAYASLKKSHSLLDQAIRDAKLIARNLTPNSLKDLGLIDTIEDMVLQTTHGTDLSIVFKHKNCEARLSDEIEVGIYRILQELINNSITHGIAKTIHLDLFQESNNLILNYKDDGKGGELEQLVSSQKGIGIKNIQTRVNSLTGELDFDIKPEKGISVKISVPMA